MPGITALPPEEACALGRVWWVEEVWWARIWWSWCRF